MCEDRFKKNKIYDKHHKKIKRFGKFKRKAIKKKNIKIYVQDEVMFEVNKDTKRILMLPKKRIRLKLVEKLHQWKKISWFLGVDWKAKLFEIPNKTWESFRKTLVKLYENINSKKHLKIIFVDNLSSHFTIDVLVECLKRNILLVKFPT